MRRSLLALSVYLSISVLFLSFRSQKPVIFLRNVIMYLFYPAPEQLSYIIGESKRISISLHSILTVYRENIRLREKMRGLLKRISDMEEMRMENKRLKEITGLQEKEDVYFKVARITGKEPLSSPHIIIIDKGKEDGIEVDDIILGAAAEDIG